MNKWDYGGAFERHPIQTGTAVFDNGSRLKAGSLFDPLPDLCFVRIAFLLTRRGRREI